MIKEFTDLHAWQACKELTIAIYRATDPFPKSEQFGLVSQLRRASASSAANIAEGFGRRSQKDIEHFYVMALGSLVEVKSHILIAHELSFMGVQDKDECLGLQTKSAKLLQGLLRAHRASSIQNQESNT